MAGVLLIIMGLLPKISAVVASIPLPVLGGAALVLFGGVAATGIKILGSVDLEDNRNLLIVAVQSGHGHDSGQQAGHLWRIPAVDADHFRQRDNPFLSERDSAEPAV